MDNTVLWYLLSFSKLIWLSPDHPNLTPTSCTWPKILFSFMTEHFKSFVNFEYSNNILRFNVGLTVKCITSLSFRMLKDLSDCLHPCSSVINPHCLIKYPKHQHLSTFDWLIHNLTSVLIFPQNLLRSFKTFFKIISKFVLLSYLKYIFLFFLVGQISTSLCMTG